MRELLPNGRAEGIYLIPPEDPRALLSAIEQFVTDRDQLINRPLHRDLNAKIKNDVSGRRLLAVVQTATAAEGQNS